MIAVTDFLTPEQARQRFGDLMVRDGAARKYLEFTDEASSWVPKFDFWFRLTGYALQEDIHG